MEKSNMANTPSAEACSALIEYWAKEYKRLFSRSSSGVGLTKVQQIPPSEMKKYIENYKKWYEVPVSQEDTKGKLLVLRRISEAWQLNVDTINKLIKYMESTIAVVAVMLIVGCQSGLYKVSTSEDDKKIDESVRYYEVESNGFDVDFMKDKGTSPDGILYDEERMPVVITRGPSDEVPDKPGLSCLLCVFTLGIFPICESECITQEMTVMSPIGEKTGSYRVDVKRWSGWIPLFIGYPGLADERDPDAKLPNLRMENVARNRLVKQLVSHLSHEYLAFAEAKNKERKDELARIKKVSKDVDELIEGHKFRDAGALIARESQPREGTRKCDEETWKDMVRRVEKAHEDFDRKRVETLIAAGKFEEAVIVCNSKESLLGDARDDLRSKALDGGFDKLTADVSKQVDEYIAKDRFAEANELIKNAERSPFIVDRGGFGGTVVQFADIRTRVTNANKAYDEKYVRSLIKSGKFEEAIAFCNKEAGMFGDGGCEFGDRKDPLADQLKYEVVTHAVKAIDDTKRLVALLKVISDQRLRDAILMKLMELKSVAQLSKEEMVEIVRTSKREEVISAVVEAIEEKSVLVSLLNAQLSTKTLNVIFVKLADPDAVRDLVWGDPGNSGMRAAYVSAYGSDDESDKIIAKYFDVLSESDVALLKGCCEDPKIRAALSDLQIRLITADVDRLPDAEVAPRVMRISDAELRSKVAMRALYRLPEHLGDVRADIQFVKGSPTWHPMKDELNVYQMLVRALRLEDRESRVRKILEECKGRIHIEGFYVGMSLQDFCIMSAHTGQSPTGWMPPLPKFHVGRKKSISFEDAMEDLMSRSLECSIDTSFDRLVFDRKLRFALTGLEDGELWPAVMRKYIPHGKTKSIGEAITDVLDSSSYRYQEEYDDTLEEGCFVYKSMKYGTKVLFGLKSGTLVLEKYE